MATYTVQIPWTNEDGEHKPGDPVEIPDPGGPEARADLDTLLRYGIIVPGKPPEEPIAEAKEVTEEPTEEAGEEPKPHRRKK